MGSKSENPRKVSNGQTDIVSFDLEENFATSTTCHGVAHIFETKGSRRSMWFGITLVSTIACLVQCCIIVYDASLYPTRVNIKVKYNTQSLFPSVTLCNTNLIASIDNTREELKYAMLLYRHYYAKNQITHQELQSAENYFNRVYGKNFSLEEYVARYRFKAEDMIVSCQWGEEPCGSANFSQVITDYGTCYTFNSGQKGYPLLYQTISGSSHGLRLAINVQQYVYPTLPLSFLTPDAGIRLSVHHYNEIANMGSRGVFVPPGMHGYIAITDTHVLSNLGPPWGECGQKNLQYFRYYSRSACRREFEANLAAQQCNCSYQQATVNTENKKTLNSFCPYPCQQTEYPIILSYAGIATNAIIDSSSHNGKLANLLDSVKNDPSKYPNYTSEAFIRENLIYLDVYFRELITSTTTESKATGYAQVLSDVGGQLGLFIGASIITLCEIITYLCDRCERKKREKREMRIHRQSQMIRDIMQVGVEKKDLQTETKPNKNNDFVFNTSEDGQETSSTNPNV
ncbi:uncharacterized protein TRIADDRAFT_58144 [Trichoplax adhaerens]|uniref:Uncharacterized protein n=1 Tax=Trichoplax adhaerens TaxID=10228 RepID=B3S100_TRIAD|nr:hypothetical protein TRIADDRAFT_58144 [Trichoplax adhaerens]EDV23481.1 hypothetical protein TRIADDRAFT_58144 [Trichoplax adhaerens]|eukprot:XP_002114391.1 hypothetical protein TRIADDRAFT_58144 [Trichoplax adhaerens]